MKTFAKESARLRSDMDAQNTREALRMKRDAMISSVADTVAQDWYRRCVRCPVTMNLYWRKPRNGEKAACPIIDAQAPNVDFQPAGEVPASMSKDRVASMVREAMHTLPMLSAEWYQA